MHSFYNPVPIGSVIISTLRTISVIQPKEYGGTDKPSIIFTAIQNMTIVNTIFDSTSRDLYILFSNATDNIIYIRQLISVEKLDSVVYQLPISFNVSDINKFTSFSSDFQNKRAFLTSQSGVLTMFSMSGTMQTIISYPSSIIDPIRSVGYNQILNRLFIITHSTVYSCIGLDTNNLQCCRALPQVNQLRSITFDTLTNKLLVYVLDERSGIYRVSVNETTGCPTDLSPISALGGYYNIYLAMYQDLHFSSGSNDNSNHNSILVIGNGTQTARTIPFDASIVALHTSYPNLKSATDKEETCFHGITYYDYRVAVVLAAIFGTVMGIFMCFNALFCIDFFMTKRIIRDLKKQIPHNLLEDRWNKLVQEKYAKLALEIHRKKDDPPPKRKSSAGARKTSVNDSAQPTNDGPNRQLLNPIPKLSGYIRRKSEDYLSRRRSDDYRTQRQYNDNRSSPKTNQKATTNAPQVHINGIKEEGIRENISQHDLLKNQGSELL